jgi:hypothetical protein
MLPRINRNIAIKILFSDSPEAVAANCGKNANFRKT